MSTRRLSSDKKQPWVLCGLGGWPGMELWGVPVFPVWAEEEEPRRGFVFPARAVAQGPLGGEEEAPGSCGNTVGGTCPVIHLVPPDDWSGSCGVCGCPGGAFLSEEESRGVSLTLRGQQSLAGCVSACQTTSSVSCPAWAGHPFLPLRAVGHTQGQVRLS